MCFPVLSPWQLKYNNVRNPEEVYFLVTRVNYYMYKYFVVLKKWFKTEYIFNPYTVQVL